MTKHGVRLYRVVPGATALTPLIVRFCRGAEGTITSFEDSLLSPIKQIVGENGDIEIAPLGILVKRCLSAAGENVGEIATRTQHLAAIAKSAETLDEDSILRKSLRFPGNREAMAELLDELDGWEVDYRTIAESMGAESRLSENLLELGRLRSSTANLLSLLGRDLSVDQMKRCFECYIDPEVKLPRLMVIVGSEASPVKTRWLSWLVEQGCDLTVIAPRHAAAPFMFEDLNHLAGALGCSEEQIGGGNLLSNNLFANENTPAVGIKAEVVIAANPMSECEEALRRLQEEGEEDVAIFVRDLETYAPLLEATSESMGIDIRLPRRTDLLDNAFARLALDCIEACAKEDVRRFLPLLKRSYLTLPKESRQFLETAIAEARKEPRTQWATLAAMVEENPDRPEWFDKLLKWRKAAVPQSLSLLAWVGELRELGDILPWHEAFEESSDYDPKRDERAFHVMQTSLSTQAQLDGSNGVSIKYSLKAFSEKCREIWTTSDVSIPARSFGVPVVGSPWAIPPVKRLLVLGMLEGVFPRRRRENPILGDLDRKAISKFLPRSSPLKTSSDSATEDREMFYVLCSSPSEELRLSYPAAGEDRDNIPTFYLQRVRDALGALETIDLSIPTWDSRTAYNPTNPENPFADQTLTLLAKSRDVPISPRALQDALVCPFRYQMRHSLELYPRARTAAWYNLRLLPDLADLFSSTDVATAEQALRKALQRELDQLLPVLSEWELRLLRGGGERLLSEWIQREFVSRSMWPRTGERYGERALGASGIRDMMPGSVRVSAKVSGVSHLHPSSKVLHLYNASAPQGAELGDDEQLYYGLYFLASYELGMESAIEVDGMDGSRTLLVLDRTKLPNLISKSKERIRVVDLSGSKGADEAKREFFQRTRKSLTKAIEVVEIGEYRATPGEHCERCDYGELCRQSLFFSDRKREEVVDL